MLRYQPPPLPSNPVKIVLALTRVALLLLLAVTGVAAGRRVMALAGVRRQRATDKWERGLELLVALGLGWAVVMYATLALGIIGMLYSLSIWGLLVVFAILGGWRELAGVRDDVKALLKPSGAGWRPTLRVGMAAVGVMLGHILVIALAPSITHDAMVYHLNVPRMYAEAHRIVPIPYDLFSNTLLNVEMLYTAALLIDDFILANLIHFTFGLATLAFIYWFGRRTLGVTTAALGAFIFFFNPSVIGEMPIAYGDIAMTFYFVLALYCVWRWRQDESGPWFVLGCVCAGIFAGMKYTAVYGLVSLGLAIAAAEYLATRRAASVIKRLALFGAIVAAFVSPYLIKNYLITGNPVYPVMYNIFGGRWLMPAQVERMLSYVESHGMGHDWRNMLLLPWNITIYGNTGFETFDTIITPLWLISIPALIFVRLKPPVIKWAVFVCAVYFLSWSVSTHITRYMMPIFPLASIVTAHVLVELKRSVEGVSRRAALIYRTGVIAACALVWFSFCYFYLPRGLTEFGPAVWGNQTREDFLARKVINYSAFKYMNEELPPKACVMFFWDNRGFFCERKRIGDSVMEAPTMIELVHGSGSPEGFRELLRDMGVTHVFFNETFLGRFPPHTVSGEDRARFENDLSIFRAFLAKYCVSLFTATGATVYEVRY